MKPNTNYGLRNVGDAEIIAAFGSLAACVRVTGGDLPTILFYVHNPDRLTVAQPCADRAIDDFALGLRHRALVEQAGEKWDSLVEAQRKPTVTFVAQELHISRSTAASLLRESGRRVAA